MWGIVIQTSHTAPHNPNYLHGASDSHIKQRTSIHQMVRLLLLLLVPVVRHAGDGIFVDTYDDDHLEF